MAFPISLTVNGVRRDVEFDIPPHAVDGEADGEGHAVLRSMLWSNWIEAARG